MTKSEMRVALDVAIDRLRHAITLSSAQDVIPDLEAIRAELQNRPRKTNGAAVSKTVDTTVVATVKALHKHFPEMPQHEIAKRAGINQGRVSEILAGKRQ